ncbi:MAG: hypothetical protein R6U57_10530, partial [Anaerolineales bacterium]
QAEQTVCPFFPWISSCTLPGFHWYLVIIQEAGRWSVPGMASVCQFGLAYPVGHTHGGEAERNEHGAFARRRIPEAVEDFILGPSVQAGRGFVQHQHLGVGHECPDQLALYSILFAYVSSRRSAKRSSTAFASI